MSLRPVALVATAVLAGAGAGPSLLGSPAAALSCVPPGAVLADADRVLAGTILDADDNRILVGVTETWSGGPVAPQVWLDVDLVVWSSWAGRDGEIPDGFTSHSTWVFAPDRHGSVNPCTSWPLSRVAQHRPAEATRSPAASWLPSWLTSWLAQWRTS